MIMDWPALEQREQDWSEQAVENVEKWGEQTIDDLTLAWAEEVGEFAAEVLARSEPADSTEAAACGRDLLRELVALGDDIQQYLECVGEDDSGPVDAADRPTLLVLDDDVDQSASRTRLRSELGDTMAVGYQLNGALDRETLDQMQDHVEGSD